MYLRGRNLLRQLMVGDMADSDPLQLFVYPGGCRFFAETVNLTLTWYLSRRISSAA